MQKLAVGIVWAVGLILVGCGSSNNSQNINGNWGATLMDANSNPTLSFSTSITQMSNGSLSITNLHFSTNSPCFVSGETATGSFSLGGTSTGTSPGRSG